MGIALLFIMELNIQSMNTVRTWTGFWILFYACIRYLLVKNPSLVLVNTEDLWLEKEQQNKPGTVEGNWKQKLKYSIEKLPLLF